MFKIGDEVKLMKRGKIWHDFEVGKVYKVVDIRGRDLIVSNGKITQLIEAECFQHKVNEEIIYDE